MKARKTSRRMVREGVSCRYRFHTWRAISWGDERGDSVLDVGAFIGGMLAEVDGCRVVWEGGFAAPTAGAFVAVD